MSDLMTFYMYMLGIFGAFTVPFILFCLFMATKAKLQGGEFFKRFCTAKNITNNNKEVEA